jgi:uncharacterized glyoxalase superfamily protein PhnB
MLTEERTEYGAVGPLTLGGSATDVMLYVPDVDAIVERALKAGAKPTMPLQNQFWGDRAGGIVDPFGHKWMIATHVEDPSPQEIEQRAKAIFANPNCA